MTRRQIGLTLSVAEEADWLALCAVHGGPKRTFRYLLKLDPTALPGTVDLPAALEAAAAELRRLKPLERFAGARKAATLSKP